MNEPRYIEIGEILINLGNACMIKIEPPTPGKPDVIIGKKKVRNPESKYWMLKVTYPAITPTPAGIALAEVKVQMPNKLAADTAYKACREVLRLPNINVDGWDADAEAAGNDGVASSPFEVDNDQGRGE